eukprot:COSAG03_NODE_9260_length_734_cov_1.020472_2_plen_109_part_01
MCHPISEVVQCWLFMHFSGCFIDDTVLSHTDWLTENIPLVIYDGSASADQIKLRRFAYEVFPTFAVVQLMCLICSKLCEFSERNKPVMAPQRCCFGVDDTSNKLGVAFG